MQQLISELHAANIGRILPNEPLAHHTTWKIGGPADLLLIPDGKQQLVETIQLLRRHNVTWTKIGRGSNMLVSDKGIRGAVVKLGKGLDYIRFEDRRVIAGGTFGLIKLSVLAAKQGLTGLEFAGGIPGSVGGAVYMNAGAHGSDVSHVLNSAEVLLETGELVRYQAGDLQFSYRHSILQQMEAIVTEAEFGLVPGNREEITAVMALNKARRLETQPLQSACAGSVFRNPERHYAAKLIEESGLKGLRVGGAEVSTQHANFIVNTGQATAEDVLTLMKQVQTEVQQKYGIRLVPEVLVVGDW